MRQSGCFLLLSMFVISCGGDYIPPPAPAPEDDASAAGIWRGMDSAQNELFGIVLASGEFRFISEGAQYVGTIRTSGNDLFAELTAIMPIETTFDDGSRSATGTLDGTIEERSAITALLSLTTSSGAHTTRMLELTFDTIYDRDSSLDTIAGNYRQLGTADVASINNDGTLFMQRNADTGCVLNGSVTTEDSRINVYRFTVIYDSCVGEHSRLNGQEFEGLGTLDNTESPERIVAGITAVSGDAVGVTLILERL